MKNVLKARSGMTLIEVIVAMLLFTVLAVSVTAILLPILKTYARANDLAELTLLIENIGSEIVDDLNQSTANADIGATNETISIKIGSNVVDYKIDSGILQKQYTTNDKTVGVNGKIAFYNVFDGKYYKHKTLRVEYKVDYKGTGDTKPIYTVLVGITIDEGQELTSTFTSKPLVLNQYSAP